MPVRFEEEKPAVRFEAEDTEEKPKKALYPSDWDEGPVAAAINNAGNAVSFGASNKITAAAQAAMDKLSGKDFDKSYDDRLQYQDERSASLKKNHPWTSNFSEAGASFLNPLNRILPGAGAIQKAEGVVGKSMSDGARKMLGNVLEGSSSGVLQAAGTSRAKPLDSMEGAAQFGEDMLHGAKLGAIGGGAVSAAGKAMSYVPAALKKGASVLLGANEDAVGRYAADKDAVMSSPTREESVDKVKDLIGRLKERLFKESDESYKILNKAGVPLEEGVSGPQQLRTYTGADISNVYASAINDIMDKSQGVLTDAKKKSVKHLEKEMAPFLENENTKFTGGKIKEIVQELQALRKKNKTIADVDAPEAVVLKKLEHSFNNRIKSDVPEYAEKMVDVADKTKTLGEAQKLFRTDQGLMGTLDRVRRERAPFAEKTLDKLDAQFGTSTVEDLKNALARESFEKGAQGPGGSRNVNLYGNSLGEWLKEQNVPFGKAIGHISGGVVDKFGPSIAKGGIDAYRGAQNMSQNPTVRSYVEALGRMGDKAKVSPNINPVVTQYLIDRYFGEKNK